jgi:hypothetical protein
MKKIVRLTESDLHRIVKESVKRILREGKYDLDTGGYDLHASLTDGAFDDSETLEDFDEKMKERDYFDKIGASNGFYNHPQSGHSVGAHKYVHPEDFYNCQEDDVLNQLEINADNSRKAHGFPS